MSHVKGNSGDSTFLSRANIFTLACKPYEASAKSDLKVMRKSIPRQHNDVDSTSNHYRLRMSKPQVESTLDFLRRYNIGIGEGDTGITDNPNDFITMT